MELELRIVALERSLNRQRKISTGLLCVLFAGLGMGATSAVKDSVEITNGGFGRPLKVVLVNGTSRALRITKWSEPGGHSAFDLVGAEKVSFDSTPCIFVC